LQVDKRGGTEMPGRETERMVGKIWGLARSVEKSPNGGRRPKKSSGREKGQN